MKLKGIYGLDEKDCGCKIKHYIGGKVVVEGCRKHRDKTGFYFECRVCDKTFLGKMESKKHQWEHAI